MEAISTDNDMQNFTCCGYLAMMRFDIQFYWYCIANTLSNRCFRLSCLCILWCWCSESPFHRIVFKYRCHLFDIFCLFLIVGECVRETTGDWTGPERWVTLLQLCIATTIILQWRYSLRRKCFHNETCVTGCPVSCHFDNFRCSWWWITTSSFQY